MDISAYQFMLQYVKCIKNGESYCYAFASVDEALDLKHKVFFLNSIPCCTACDTVCSNICSIVRSIGFSTVCSIVCSTILILLSSLTQLPYCYKIQQHLLLV